MSNGSTTDCPRPTMYAQSAEKLVWEAVAKFLAAPKQVSALLAARQQELEGGAVIEILNQARHRLSLVEAERGRRLSQHSKVYITDQELDLVLREIIERLEYHQEELTRLEAEVSQTTEAIGQLQNWMDGYRSIVARLDTLTAAERAEVVRLVVDRVTVVGREFQIRMVLDSRGYTASEPHQLPA